MKEIFRRKNTEFIRRLNPTRPTPRQIDLAINGGSFEDLEPLYPPTEQDLDDKIRGTTERVKKRVERR